MIFRTKQIFICLGILILAASAVNSFGPASDLKNPILSLDTKNMPLAEVLQEISEVSGYKIVVRGEADISVSLKLKDVGLEMNQRLRQAIVNQTFNDLICYSVEFKLVMNSARTIFEVLIDVPRVSSEEDEPVMRRTTHSIDGAE